MCTVTFFPKSTTNFILTSNRDESPGRSTLAPHIYSLQGIDLLFPKDEVAGGTWIGASSRKRIVCLMNGGFTAHQREASYRMSRGIIVTNLLTAEDAVSKIESFDFTGIEPFTIILVDWEKELRLYELVWDGEQHHLAEKPLAPQIWSSSLLYTEDTKRKREQWFSQFLFETVNPSEAEILHFHKTAGEGNIASNLIMNRDFVKTKSLTQIVKNDTIAMRYEDLQTNTVTTQTLQ
ncbi:transport and Golgi organization protein 2 [Ulvibacter sp. MAR_2010_11]|uniref:NRDE family protein n=1 Tax=Ulvibacter sp. MAR_2010_11 TaxID=1250229 RepID=UPI000C2C04DB|nr:NRDE family protein [Ulvibacter sp. MAR_2010_11]PKA82314.1 transport and Golgi organization protein 2 [Ulvibacter sp. MAR_2010_11]